MRRAFIISIVAVDINKVFISTCDRNKPRFLLGYVIMLIYPIFSILNIKGPQPEFH